MSLRIGALVLLGWSVSLFADSGHLRYLPSDTKALLTIQFPNLAEVERTAGLELFQQLYRTHLASELGEEAKLPLTEVSSVVIAMPYAGSINGVIFVTGKVDRTVLDQQMQRVAKSSNALTIERLGSPPVAVYTRTLNEKALLELVPPLEKVPPRFRRLVAPYEAHVAVLDDSTLMTSLSGKKQIERALRARGSNRLRVSEELGSVIKKLPTRDVTTGVMLEDCLHPGLALVADDAVRETFTQLDYITLRIIGGEMVQFLVEVQGKSSDLGPILEKKARSGLDALHGLLPTLFPDPNKRAIIEQLIKSFVIERKDDRITLKGRIAEREWRKLSTSTN